MNSRKAPTLTSFGLAFIFLCSGESALTTEVTIGSWNIVIPEAAGFAALSDEALGQHPIASILVEDCPVDLCAVFSGSARDGESSASRWEDVPPFFMVQVLNDSSPTPLELFNRMVQSIRTDLDGLRTVLAESVSEEKMNLGLLSLDDSGLEFIDAPVELSGDAYDGANFLAIPAIGSNNYRRPDGSVVSYEFHMTQGFIHAGDQVLMLVMLRPGKDAEWSQRAFVEYAEALAKANSLD